MLLDKLLAYNTKTTTLKITALIEFNTTVQNVCTKNILLKYVHRKNENT